MSAVPTLALRDVSKSFGMTAALADMTLELFPGEVHAIVGENGAGKSTMIKIMTGIYQPSSGQVEIDGAPVVLSGSKAARLRGVAAIYQEPMVFPDLDVTENIFISATDAGLVLDRRNMRRRAEALIDRIGALDGVERTTSSILLAILLGALAGGFWEGMAFLIDRFDVYVRANILSAVLDAVAIGGAAWALGQGGWSHFA